MPSRWRSRRLGCRCSTCYRRRPSRPQPRRARTFCGSSPRPPDPTRLARSGAFDPPSPELVKSVTIRSVASRCVRNVPRSEEGAGGTHERDDRRGGPGAARPDDALRTTRGSDAPRNLPFGRAREPASARGERRRYRAHRAAVRPEGGVRGLPRLPAFAPRRGTGAFGGLAVPVRDARGDPRRRCPPTEPRGVRASPRGDTGVGFAPGGYDEGRVAPERPEAGPLVHRRAIQPARRDVPRAA